MKLLSKSEVNLQNALQRKDQIESGMSLAGRVDRLRETFGQLQSEQREFILGSQKAIDEAVAEGFARKKSLDGEISLLEERKRVLMEPLDAEWRKLEHDRSEFDLRNAELCSKLALEDEKQQKMDNLIIQAEQERHRASNAHETALENARRSDEVLKETESKLFEISSFLEQSKSEHESKMSQLAEKERVLDYDRKHYLDFEAELKKRENELKLLETRFTIKSNANRPEQQNRGTRIRPGNA